MNQRFGFTLVEILVALAVMAVLAGISIPVTAHQLNKAKTNSTRKEMSGIGESIRAYATDVGFDPGAVIWGRFPAEVKGPGKYKTILGLELLESPAGSAWNAALRKGWNGPYVSPDQVRTSPDGQAAESNVLSYQVDGWGRYYVYRNRNAAGKKVKKTDTEREITLISGGSDRNPSTAADNITVIVYRGAIY